MTRTPCSQLLEHPDDARHTPCLEHLRERNRIAGLAIIAMRPNVPPACAAAWQEMRTSMVAVRGPFIWSSRGIDSLPMDRARLIKELCRSPVLRLPELCMHPPIGPASRRCFRRRGLEEDKELEPFSSNPQGERCPAGEDFSTKMAVQGTVPACVLLIAGGTIGGGFLALPYATAPFGFAPSLVSMLLCWAYLCTSALILAEVHIATGSGFVGREGGDTSINSIATRSLGSRAGKVLSLCFLVLVQATLVAQIARGGSIVSSMLQGCVPSAACSALLVIPLAMVVFRCRARVVDSAQSLLTWVMMGAFASVVVSGMQHVQLGLLVRSDWAGFPSSFAVILQLLSFAEMVPTVCQRLGGDRAKIRVAVILGSLIPLLMCIIWSSVAIGLVPWAGSGLASDPVDALLNLNVTGGIHFGHLVSALGLSAISTTIIGSFLALGGLFGDLLGVRSSSADGGNGNGGDSTGSSRWRVLFAQGLAVVPPLLLSMGGPRMFYIATEFAGAYPVTILWGLAPPLMLWGLKMNKQRADNHCSGSAAAEASKIGGTVAVLAVIIGLLGAAMLVQRLCDDSAAVALWFSRRIFS